MSAKLARPRAGGQVPQTHHAIVATGRHCPAVRPHCYAPRAPPDRLPAVRLAASFHVPGTGIPVQGHGQQFSTVRGKRHLGDSTVVVELALEDKTIMSEDVVSVEGGPPTQVTQRDPRPARGDSYQRQPRYVLPVGPWGEWLAAAVPDVDRRLVTGDQSLTVGVEGQVRRVRGRDVSVGDQRSAGPVPHS